VKVRWPSKLPQAKFFLEVSDEAMTPFGGFVPLAAFFEKLGLLDWIASASRLLWQAAPERFILDWDSTVQTRYGHQEGACVGYNPQKPGRKSHHPLLAVIADTRLCPYYRWRPGNTGSSTQWIEAMEESVSWIGRLPWLNRGDVGFCSEQIMA
jgi:hypothetical protein